MSAQGDLALLSVLDTWTSDGGVVVGECADWVEVTERWDVDAGWSCTARIARRDGAATALVRRNILRLELDDGAVREYRISDVRDGRGSDAETISVTGQDARLDLAERVLLSTTGTGGVVYFDDSRAELAIDDYLDDVIVPACVAAGIPVSKGTISAPIAAVLVSVSWTRSSALGLVQQLVEAIRDRGIACEFDYRRNGATDFKLDFLTQIGSGATTPELHVGRHVTAWTRRRASADQASRVVPFGGVDATGYAATLGHAAWEVSAVAGDVVTLIDPLGGAGPIQFTNQHADPAGGWYLRATDGTLTAIQASSRTSATVSSVTVDTGDGALFTVGDVVEVRADAAGTLLTSLTHPTYIQAPPTGYGEKIVPLERPALRGERNLAINPWGTTWTTPTNPPDGWTVTAVNAAPAAHVTTITREVVAGGLVQFGPYALRLTGNNNYGGARIDFPAMDVEPVAGADLFTVSFSLRSMVTMVGPTALMLYIAPAGGPSAIVPGNPHVWIVPGGSIPLDARWDVTVAGVQLPVGTTQLDLRLQVIGPYDLVVDAYQVTQTAQAADAFFVGPRGNALWQAGNEYLSDWGDPPPEFEGNLLDYARLAPSTWAAVAVAPGASTRVVDDDRALDLTVRAVRLEWNRMMRGDTRITWATRPRSFVATDSGGSRAALQPTSTPPVPSTPGSPGLNPNPVTPVPGAAAQPGVLLLPFNVRGQQTLTDLPASEAERTSDNEAWIYLADYQWARLEGVVVTAASQGQLVAKYSADDGATWDYLDGTSGPVLDLTATGTVRGDDVAIDDAAKTDVIVALFESGGNGTDDPVVGSVFLHCHTGIQLVNTPASGCPIPGGIEFEGDLSAYADLGALYTARGDDADGTMLFNTWYGAYTAGAQTDLDTGRLFNGAPGLMGYYEAAGAYTGSGFDTGLPGGDDYTHFMVFEIESGFDNTETGRQAGLQILDWSTNNPGGLGYNTAGIYLRSGRVYFDWYSAGVWSTAVDLGATASWTGQKYQLVMRCERLNSTQIEVSIYLDAPCTTPSILHQATYPAAQATNQWASISHFNSTFSPMPTPGKKVWMWQVGWDTNAATYGV